MFAFYVDLEIEINEEFYFLIFNVFFVALSIKFGYIIWIEKTWCVHKLYVVIESIVANLKYHL